jgi:DNA-binding NarL/FixJ family response regulator
LFIEDRQKILSFLQGQLYNEIINIFSKAINEKFTKDAAGNDLNFSNICNDNKINTKEKEIIKLLISGLEYKEISNKLSISLSIVKKRVHNIYKKLKVQNKIELINLFAKKL